MDIERDKDKSVAYLCNECKTRQSIIFTPKMNQELILDDPEFQASGLALFSHTHVCKFGILGVNSLFIDLNLDVRSYNYVNLPKYKIKTKVSIPMPGSLKSVDGAVTTLRITHLREKNDFNLTLYNEYSESLLIIGKPDFKNSTPTKSLTSGMGSVKLKYYSSSTPYTSEMEQWLISLINNIEVLPPSRLGLILEVLLFILDEKENTPSEFDKMIIKTILASHEIYFELRESMGTEPLDDYGRDESLTMKEILRLYQESPMKPLHEYALSLNINIVVIIYCFLILEKHEFLTIHRPGIMTADSLSLEL